jgi:hypothetical protein
VAGRSTQSLGIKVETPMTVYDRVKVAAVLCGIFLLLTGIANAFFDTSRIDDLLFHSWLFWVAFTVAAMLIAPGVARYFPFKVRAGDGNAKARSIILGGVVVIVMGVVVLVAMVRL